MSRTRHRKTNEFSLVAACHRNMQASSAFTKALHREFMIKAIFAIILVAGLWADDSQARANELQTNNNWGSPVCGVQMSINISNNVIDVGSGFVINIEIRNSSTNTISLGESNPEKDFTVLLTDKSGKTYQLTRTDPFFTRLLRMDLKPAESHDWTLSVGIDKYYESPGFVATNQSVPPREIHAWSDSKVWCRRRTFLELQSNLLKVQIK